MLLLKSFLDIINEGKSTKSEMEEIDAIKCGLIRANCPYVQKTEELHQIKNLLEEPSDHKNQLIQWILEELTDTCDFEIEEVTTSFGLDLNSLQGWKMALNLLKAKESFSNCGYEGLNKTREYLHFLHQGGFALPIKTNSGSLLPRDIGMLIRANFGYKNSNIFLKILKI